MSKLLNLVAIGAAAGAVVGVVAHYGNKPDSFLRKPVHVPAGIKHLATVLTPVAIKYMGNILPEGFAEGLLGLLHDRTTAPQPAATAPQPAAMPSTPTEAPSTPTQVPSAPTEALSAPADAPSAPADAPSAPAATADAAPADAATPPTGHSTTPPTAPAGATDEVVNTSQQS